MILKDNITPNIYTFDIALNQIAMIRKNPILILFLGVVFIYSGCKKKESSGEFKPFKHTCSIEELKEKYSSELMAQAKEPI